MVVPYVIKLSTKPSGAGISQGVIFFSNKGSLEGITKSKQEWTILISIIKTSMQNRQKHNIV